MTTSRTTQTIARNRLDPFQTTPWSLVLELQQTDDQERMDGILAELAEHYWSPVYAYLRQSGRRVEEAQDLTQGFFTDVVLGRKLLERADPLRGRLRVLLKSALKRYLVDDFRRRSTIGRRLILTDEQVLQREGALGRLNAETADEAFERQWVSVVLELAMSKCEHHYRSAGRAKYWEAFVSQELLPRVHGTQRRSNAFIAKQLGFDEPADVSNAVRLTKRRLRVLIREVVNSSANGGDHQESEYQYLMRLLQPA